MCFFCFVFNRLEDIFCRWGILNFVDFCICFLYLKVVGFKFNCIRSYI